MRKLIIAAAGVAIVMAGTSIAKAAVLAPLLTFDGLEDTLNDNSATKVFDEDGNTFLSVGDEFVGILEFEKVNTVLDPSPGGIFGVVAFQIGSFNLDGSVNLIPIANGDSHSLKSILDSDLHPTGYTDAQWDDTIGIIVETEDLSAGAGTDGATNPFDPAHIESHIGLISDAITDTRGWSYVAALGFEDFDGFGNNQHGDVDFFLARSTGNFDLSTTTIATLEADDTGESVLTQRGGFTVLDHTFGSSTKFLPVEAVTGTFHDVVLKPSGSVQTSTGTFQDHGWSFEDDGNFRLNAVPEPATITVWAGVFGGAAALGLIRRRRRKTTAKQSSAA